MMTIALLLLQAAAQPLGPIGTQALPKKGCSAYLWSVGDRQLVALAGADPAQLRLSIDGRTVDLARATQEGTTVLGLPERQVFRRDAITATLEMTIEETANLQRGARVSNGVLTIERPGQDVGLVPVAGLVGCA